VIAAIDDGHRSPGMAQSPRGVKTGESAADDYDARDRPSFIHTDDEMILRFAHRVFA